MPKHRSLKCPDCGAALKPKARSCPYCESTFDQKKPKVLNHKGTPAGDMVTGFVIPITK